MSKQVVVIAGPTGSGETTITNEVIMRFPKCARMVTATTRPPRDAEVHGVNYYFFSKPEFLDLIEQGEIIEHTYVENRDVYYGTYAPELRKKIDEGRILLMNLDIVGAKYYKENFQATTIFITTNSIDDLIARIRARSPELTENEIQNRRDNAEREVLEEGPFYDYQVKNKDGELEVAVDEVVEILKKEGYNLG